MPAESFLPGNEGMSAGSNNPGISFSAPVIDESKCTNCGRCARYCGYGASDSHFEVLVKSIQGKITWTWVQRRILSRAYLIALKPG
ncbi:MAG: 4Fe-4S binding protein [Bacteroidales bacterium]